MGDYCHSSLPLFVVSTRRIAITLSAYLHMVLAMIMLACVSSIIFSQSCSFKFFYKKYMSKLFMLTVLWYTLSAVEKLAKCALKISAFGKMHPESFKLAKCTPKWFFLAMCTLECTFWSFHFFPTDGAHW
ncbi:hypothetical protein KSP39_PZI003843 [Platanthera zijinensis]|uniref:Uncharacterized protein n=1 Tax=Platanthera zijinensis TaxID=2320716 RepID=A0AAP0BU31_9ASPA